MKIGFVLLSPVESPLPSTRIAALNLFPTLRAHGHDPQILFSPRAATETPALALSASDIAASGIDVVVFQKVHGVDAQTLASELEALEVRTVYLVCDLVNRSMCAATSATVVVTDFLRSLYPLTLRHKVHVVHDGIERPSAFKARVRNQRGSVLQPLRAAWVTSNSPATVPALGRLPAWLQLRVVGRYPPRAACVERLRLARRMWARQPDAAARRAFLQFSLDPRVRCVPWSAMGVYDELLASDVGVIPVDTAEGSAASASPPDWAVKSENRLTLMMAAGLPVVATPIPSYLPVVRHGENGFLARTPSDWISALNALRDPALRERVGRCARESVLDRFSRSRQAELFLAVLKGLGKRPADRA